MPQETPTTARFVLRAATSANHEALDGMFSGLDLADRDSYGLFLEAQAKALFAVEARLDAGEAAQVLPDWPQRRRSGALARDLDLLGLRATPLECRGFADRFEIFGAAYVLEGSRLGGKLLLRSAAASIDPLVREATHFLSHGAGTRLWPEFVAKLDALAPTPADEARMIAAAAYVFELFSAAARSMQQTAPSPATIDGAAHFEASEHGGRFG